MPPTASLSPLPAARFGPAQARHLLLRAGFGAPPTRVRELAAMGPDAAVAALINDGFDPAAFPGPDIDPDAVRPPTEEERRLARTARAENDEETLAAIQKARMERQATDRRATRDLQAWWLETMATRADHALRESLVLLWHGHFATRARAVNDAYLLYQQNAFFRAHARDFAALARGIVRDPAMLKFLNNDRNVARRPNENLARELMELFTLGEGHYTEQDIQEGARALTGYHVDDNSFAFRRGQHDAKPKTILGATGNHDGDAFVDLLLARRPCAERVALKLYRHFVADAADTPAALEPHQRTVVARLADEITRHGHDLTPVLTRLFRSEHFYDPAVVGQKIKSPAQLVAGAIQTLGAPMRDPQTLLQAMTAMGQTLFEPPSVAGWDGGRAWINTSTLFVRQNTATFLLTGRDPRRPRRKPADDYAPDAFLAALPAEDRSRPDAVATYAIDALLGDHTPAPRREPLLRFLRDRGSTVTGDSVVALLVLITALPEYQLC